MSKITSALLKTLAPGTKAELRDRFLEPLNLTLPVYGIDTKLEVAGFLSTSCFESDHFKTMREYGKGKGRKYGVPAGPYKLIYYGRGIFQNTWIAGYRKFTAYVKSHWAFIQPRAGVLDPPDFVKDPELLATTFWAVEAACWYWEENHLAKYAKQGLDGFFALQGLVNRGSAEKRALDYNDRLTIYKRALAAMPNDFKLDSTSAPEPIESERPLLKLGSVGSLVSELQGLLGIHTVGVFNDATKAAVIGFQRTHGLDMDGIVGPETWAALEQNSASINTPPEPPQSDTSKLTEQGAEQIAEGGAKVKVEGDMITAETNTQPPPNVVVEKEPEHKEEEKGFLGTIWAKITGAVTGVGGAEALTEKAQQAQVLGLSPDFWTTLFWLIAGAFAVWIIYEFIDLKVKPAWMNYQSRKRTGELIAANTNEGGTTSVESLTAARIKELEEAGYTVVRRA